MSLWSLESFIAFAGVLPTVVIHDDGTLTEKHRRLYERHFDGITVLDDSETSARMDDELAPWPACRRSRQLPGFYCGRKLFDILFFAKSGGVLYIDSDILFFRAPEQRDRFWDVGVPRIKRELYSRLRGIVPTSV